MNLANLDDLFNQVVVEHPKSELKTRSSSREASKEYQVATFERLQEKVARVSQSFHDHGLRKGDKVAIVGKPSTRWVIAFFAAQRLGAIVVPLAADLTSQEIRRILQESRSKFAVLDPGGQRKLLTVTDLLSNLELIAVYGTEAENDFLSWENLLSRGQYSGSAYSDSDDTAVLMYTSGTMGDAKGVMLSHRNLLTNVADLCDILNLGSGDTVASILPWFHIYGLTTGLLTPLAIGASTIFTDNYRQLPSVLKENGATILLGVPKLYNVLYRELKAKVHSSWITRAISRYLPEVLKWKIKRELAGSQFRFAVSGGAPLDPKVAQGLKDLGIGIYEGYGLTETSPVLTWTEDPHKDNQGSVGTPLPSVQLKIDSPDDSGAGEVLVKGPVVMQGYYKNPEKTDEAIDDDGWFHTGDLGYFRDDRWLHLYGRKKNLIVLPSGKNVYPEEVEWELARLPYIEEVLVQEKQRDGQPVVAASIYPDYGELEKDGYKTASQIKSKIWQLVKETGRNLAPYKRIKSKSDLSLMDHPFEKTPTLKVKRHLYKDEQVAEH